MQHHVVLASHASDSSKAHLKKKMTDTALQLLFTNHFYCYCQNCGVFEFLLCAEVLKKLPGDGSPKGKNNNSSLYLHSTCSMHCTIVSE